MSFIRANDQQFGPDDPRYYAPRSERGPANARSGAAAPTPPDPPPFSRFDEMREEAFAKHSRPLESQFVYERPRRSGLLVTVGAIAAAIGVTAVLALVLFNLFPGTKNAPAELAVSISTPALATPAPVTSDDSQALLQGFQQFQRTQAGQDPAVSEPATAGTAKAPERSEPLLEKFMQWEQRK